MPQALRRNDAADKFQLVTEKIEAALSNISYNKLEISEEVQEQVNLSYETDNTICNSTAFQTFSVISIMVVLCCDFEFLQRKTFFNCFNLFRLNWCMLSSKERKLKPNSLIYN